MSSSCIPAARRRYSPIRAGSASRTGEAILSLRRKNRTLDLAKPDAIAIALAPAAHHERIAVFEERALDATSKLDGLGAVPADFKQTAALALLGTGDRAAP